MAFLGSLIGGIGAVATAVAPVVGAYQTVSSLFRPAIQQPPTPHAFWGGGFQGFPSYATGDTGFFGMPRARWQVPSLRRNPYMAYLQSPSDPARVPMKSDWLGGGMWH